MGVGSGIWVKGADRWPLVMVGVLKWRSIAFFRHNKCCCRFGVNAVDERGGMGVNALRKIGGGGINGVVSFGCDSWFCRGNKL